MRTTRRRAEHDPVSSVTGFVTILTGSWTQSSYPQNAVAPALDHRQFGTLGVMHRGVPDVAELQAGVVSAAQLAGAGFTRNGLSSRVRTGRWQRLHRGVYATFSGEPGREATLWAAVLACGPGAMLSYQTAGEVAGLTDKRSWLVHVTVPGERRVAPVLGLVIHYSARASRALHPARLPPQTRIEETILDLACAATRLDDACGRVTATSSDPTGCPAAPGRHWPAEAITTSTATPCTRPMASHSSWTAGWPIPETGAGPTSAGTGASGPRRRWRGD